MSGLRLNSLQQAGFSRVYLTSQAVPPPTPVEGQPPIEIVYITPNDPPAFPVPASTPPWRFNWKSTLRWIPWSAGPGRCAAGTTQHARTGTRSTVRRAQERISIGQLRCQRPANHCQSSPRSPNSLEPANAARHLSVTSNTAVKWTRRIERADDSLVSTGTFQTQSVPS